MNLPIVIHKDRKSDYGVIVPDLPGCFSAGKTLDDVIAMAREAIELHLEGLIADGQPVPRPGSIEKHRKSGDYDDATAWAIVSVDISKLPQKYKRVNFTIPERVLAAVDRCAKREGEPRSRLLVRAVSAYVGAK